MAAKNFPRIFSLSTVGIRNHYNQDYPLHAFRTDFAGDSGVGKSIIADILQLIFVGEKEFKSATDSSSEREARKLVTGRYGYVFLNVEINPKEYIVIGMYISAAGIDPFIIQSNYGLDDFIPFDFTLSNQDFLSGEDIIDINELPAAMKDNKQIVFSKVSLNKYFELLERNEILPIDLTQESNLRNYAQIIRAFSRGKSFKNNSAWLKRFFLNDDCEKKIREQFDKHLDDIAKEIKGHKENRETLERVQTKYTLFENLYNLKAKWEEARIDYWKEKIFFHTSNITKYTRHIKDSEKNISQLNKKIATYFYTLFHSKENTYKKRHQLLTDIQSAIQKAVNTLDDFEIRYKEINENYPQLDTLYSQVNHVDTLLEEYKTYDIIRSTHTRQLVCKENKKQLQALIDDLNRSHLYEEWCQSPWVKNPGEGFNIYQNRTQEIEEKLKRLQLLQSFSDLENTKSLAYWAIHHKPSLSREQESILFHLKNLLIEKPEAILPDSIYTSDPRGFLEELTIPEKDENGFWMLIGKLHLFIPFVPKTERFFTSENSKQAIAYFEKNFRHTKERIAALNKEKQQLNRIYQIVTKHGEKVIALFEKKEEIFTYPIDKKLDFSEEHLNDLLTIYFDANDIREKYNKKQELQKSKTEAELILTERTNQLKQYYQLDYRNQPAAHILTSLNPLITGIQTKMIFWEKRKEKFQTIFHDYISENKSTGKETENPDYMLNKSLDEKRSARKSIKSLQTKIESEELELETAHNEYKAYSNEKLNLTVTPAALNPTEKELAVSKARNAYGYAYNQIVITYIHEQLKPRFMDGEDYMLLAKEVVSEIMLKQLANNEKEVLKEIQSFLQQLNEMHLDISNRKLNMLKDIFEAVRYEVNEYFIKIHDIGQYFKGADKQISQGYTLKLSIDHSPLYPITWIDTFLEMLTNSVKRESVHSGLFASLQKKIDIHDMMTTAFESCGGYKNAHLDELLNPKNYFNINFDMNSEDGEKNVGSSGQTYAVTAMLCVARLSLVEKKEKGRPKKGLRFMPIDEAEGIGSNFELLERIALANDFQLISMSIKALDDFNEGNQYLYILNGSKNRNERVTPFAIFSHSENLKKL